MAVAFTKLSQWLWGGNNQEDKSSDVSSSNSQAETCPLELDSVRFPLVKRGNMVSSWRKIERKIDKEPNVVVVPSHDECISVSGSDLDWSIGWLEPHGPEFLSDNELDNSFAVLVPCYGHVVDDQTNNILTVIGSMPDNFSREGKKYMEQWLSSIQPISHHKC